jgi:putative phage-type endonuclease
MKKLNHFEQGTSEWLHWRKGKITGTVLKSIMGTPRAKQDAIYEMIAQRLVEGVDDEEYESPMDRGTRLQPDAIAMFELETGKSVEEVGGTESDKNSQIASSPDGLISETEAIEIKCPGGKNHVKYWLENKLPEDYMWQIVQYFVVNEKLQTLYFVSYHPEIAVHPLHIIEIKRSDIGENILLARDKQEEFLKTVDNLLDKIIEL